MELTDANADSDSIWYVTNGLLVMELMTGRLQLGDNIFDEHSPAVVNIAGDASDPSGPTYESIAAIREEPAATVGDILNQRISRSGTISIDASLADRGIRAAVVVEESGHSIAQPFWEFMNSTGAVSINGELTSAALFPNPFFATGFPTAEPYWADVSVGGETKLVLLQCFERRCLTYTPDNVPEWRVEAGNVGLHYLAWRYSGSSPYPDPVPDDCVAGSGPRYAGQNLDQPVFISQDLVCADFSNSTVAQGNFSEADAYKADFSGAILQQPIFRNTNLDFALFVSATLVQPAFDGTSAAGADFRDALLSQPGFNDANLLGADMATTTLVEPQFINTVCPDSTNSDDNSGTCIGHLEAIPPPTF